MSDPWPQAPDHGPAGLEQWSPVQVESTLIRSVSDLTRAEKQLRLARDAEVDAELAYRQQYRRWLLSEDCPKPNRTDVTVAMRDAWVEQHCKREFEAFRRAQVEVKAAEDHSRTVRDVTTTVQSIGAMQRAQLALAGTSNP